MRALIIDDQVNSVLQMEEILKRDAGYHVYTTDDVEDGIDLAKLYDYDVLIVELDMDGLSTIAALRRAAVKTPVLALAYGTSHEQRVAALDAGADDTLTKPWHPEELVARTRALIRRSVGQLSAIIHIGDVTLDMNRRMVCVGENRIHLTPKEYAMLELLMFRHDQTITKQMFMDHLYGGMDEPEMKIIDVFICKLRRRVRLAGGPEDFIETTWGRGFTIRTSETPKIAQVAA